VVNHVIPGYPTHGKRHPSLTHFSIYMNLVWGTICQGYSLWDVVFGPKTLHTSWRVHQVFEPTHLNKHR